MAPKAADDLPSFNFILQPEFPVNALILATAALRIANQNSGQELFEWLMVSDSGEAVRASNGMWVSVAHNLANFPRADFLIVLEEICQRKTFRQVCSEHFEMHIVTAR